ncbi:DUF6678 family protein [Rhizobium leguminosarum]
MNDTKWRELCAGIRELPFPPAYQVKVLDENEPSPSTIERAPPYWGDWASTPEAALGVHVEWIRVTPRYKRHVARLLPPIIEDCSDQLRSLLRRCASLLLKVTAFSRFMGMLPASILTQRERYPAPVTRSRSRQFVNRTCDLSLHPTL